MRQFDTNVERTCDRKQRHETYYGAWITLQKVQVEHNDYTLDIYECNFCCGYHIGHSELGDRIGQRIILIGEREKAINQWHRANSRLSVIGAQIFDIKRELTHYDRLARKLVEIEFDIRLGCMARDEFWDSNQLVELNLAWWRIQDIFEDLEVSGRDASLAEALRKVTDERRMLRKEAADLQRFIIECRAKLEIL